MPFLEFSGLNKAFPGVQALADVSFGVAEGDVHALIGENGAGKSTLLKILSGAYLADSGSVSLAGVSQSYKSPHDAIKAGVSVIYQELHLVLSLTVAENIFLGAMPSKGGWMDWAHMNRETTRLLDWVGESVRPDAKVGDLPIAQRQMVEIAKALSHNAKVIAFDEPTSSLGSKEVERLFNVIGQLQKDGKVVLYVSHRMDEIQRICNSATVLRDGRHVRTFDSLNGVSTDELIELMVGRKLDAMAEYTPRPVAAEVLSVEGLTGPGVVQPVNLKVHGGEIVGVFGLVGAGRTELLKLICGARKARTGRVKVGDLVVQGTVRSGLKAGVGLCPEDRKKEGIVPMLSVQDNLNLAVRSRFSKAGFWIDGGAEKQNADHQVARFRVKTPSLTTLIKGLSGGNQQKVILGRVLGRSLKVVLLDEPTRGIDVAAKGEIHNLIRGLAAEGLATVVVSSELPELLSLCDRIVVMSEGAVTGELTHDEATQVKLLELALPRSEAS